MRCLKCHSENPAAAQFCIECGHRLEFLCPDCERKTPVTSKFCMACGRKLVGDVRGGHIDYASPRSYTPDYLADKILTTRSSVEGERKVVTVLFADVAGFTAISSSIDPEVAHQLMDGVFRIILDEIHQYEGTINQFTGDGVMALFGAPLAQENNAQRACHAAIAIQNRMAPFSNQVQEEFGFQFLLRIGINSGPVVVGSIGDDLRMDYTAVGDTTNLAARMEAVATPGRITISRYTHQLVGDYFNCVPLGKVEVKGKDEPQEAFELSNPTEIESRLEASVAKGLTRFVGRQDSMMQLKDRFEAARSGVGQIVGLAGDAGVGKSRLLFEFVKQIPKKSMTYLEGRCLNYGHALTYLPLGDILKMIFEVEETDKVQAIRDKLVSTIGAMHTVPDEALAPIEDLLSLPVTDDNYRQLEPQHKREKTFQAIRDLLIGLSQDKPVVIAFEDVHWIDKTSEAFINDLTEYIESSQILLILIYRPEYTHTLDKSPHYKQIRLSQLGVSSSIELMQAIFEGVKVAPELRELIFNKATGNPLFIEEFTRSLVENRNVEKVNDCYRLSGKPDDFDIPDTIQGLIAARIDRLDDNIKRTIQVASVIGRDFAYRILQIITGMKEGLKSHLLSLQGLEFIYEKSLFPELEYIFKHALTQEVAYFSLLTARRKTLHQKAGEAMEIIFSDRLNEFSGIMGEHFFKGENWDRAVFYLNKAGDIAKDRFAHSEARVHFARALEALTNLETSPGIRRLCIDTTLKWVLTSWRAASVEESLTLLGKAERIAEDLSTAGEASDKDKLRLARIHYWMGRVRYSGGQMAEALGYFKQVLPVGQAAGDRELSAIPSSAIGQVMAVLGNVEKARALLGQAIPYFEETGNAIEWIQATSYLGAARASSGEYIEGVQQVKQAFERARELNFITGLGICNICLSMAYIFGGDLENARQTAADAVRVAQTSGDRIYEMAGYGMQGWAAGRAGQLEEAFECLIHSKEVAEALGGKVVMGDLLTVAGAEVAMYFGQYEKAMELVEKAVSIAQMIVGIFSEGAARRVWGQILATQPSQNWQNAEAQFQDSIRILASGQNWMEVARTHMVWGTLCLDRGDNKTAHHHLNKAAERFANSEATRELDNIRRLMPEITVPME